MIWAEQIAGIDDDMGPRESWAYALRRLPYCSQAVTAAWWLNQNFALSGPGLPLTEVSRREQAYRVAVLS